MENNKKKVRINTKAHAALDSIPLRLGFKMSHDKHSTFKELGLFECGILANDRVHDNRKHIIATFNHDDGKSYRAQFVLAQNINPENDFFGLQSGAPPWVVTVLLEKPIFNDDTEFGLSAILTDMRKRELITPDDLIKMHPKYLEGKICNSGDVINALADIRAANKRIEDIIPLHEKALSNLAYSEEKRAANEAYLHPQSGQRVNVAPAMTLLNVEERLISNAVGISRKTIVLHFRDTSTERKNNWPRGYDARYAHCISLIGKTVVTDSWGNFDPVGWFQNIEEVETISIPF